MRKIRLELTLEDIEQGLACDGNACPLSLAARRAGLREPHVGSTRITWGPFSVWPEHATFERPVRAEAPLPLEAQRWVHDFDACFTATTWDEREKGAPDYARNEKPLPAPIACEIDVPDEFFEEAYRG